MAVRISNCAHNEVGKWIGGKAGDQTGHEWEIRDWYKYSKGWKCVLRYPDKSVREKFADLGEKAARNNNIGYDMGVDRDTYWPLLVKANYDPSKIAKPCETDCSGGVIADVRATGFLMNIPALRNITSTYTKNMRSGFKAAGFIVLTDSKYLTSSDYLLRGDILLNDDHHTCTVLDNGAKSGSSSSSSTAKKSVSEIAKEVIAGKWGNGAVRISKLKAAGYDPTAVQKEVDRLLAAEKPKNPYPTPTVNVKKGSKGNNVRWVQWELKRLGYDLGKYGIDGDFGSATDKAVRAFQKKHKLTVDGIVGKNTRAALKAS